MKFPLVLVKQVFNNEDGSEGVLYLVSSDLTLDYDGLSTIYQRDGGKWRSITNRVEIERLVGQVADQDDKDAVQPCICFDLCVREAGASEGGNEAQSLCVAFTDVPQSGSSGVCRVAKLTPTTWS